MVYINNKNRLNTLPVIIFQNLFSSVVISHSGPVHTYLNIFESATFSFRIQKFLRPHVLTDSLRIYYFPLWTADSKYLDSLDASGRKPHPEINTVVADSKLKSGYEGTGPKYQGRRINNDCLIEYESFSCDVITF